MVTLCHNFARHQAAFSLLLLPQSKLPVVYALVTVFQTRLVLLAPATQAICWTFSAASATYSFSNLSMS